MNILAIGAHPDDIEHGCGGTLLKFAAARHSLFLLIMTGGEEGGNREERIAEQEKASDILKVKRVFWGNFRDTEIPLNKTMISRIEDVVREVRPDEVYINWPDDTHQDHRMLAHGGIAAARYVRRVLFYETYTSQNFEPDFFVDIEDVLEDKINLMKVYKSQISKTNPANINMIEAIKATALFRGFQGKVKYAEGFKLLRFLRDI